MIPIKERLNAWTTGLRQSGRRVTASRVEIFRILAEAKDHPTAQQIFERARRRLPTLSRATVYNTLDALVKAGEAIALRMQAGRPVRFDGTRERHHHFICSRCDCIEDLYQDELDRLTAPRGVGRVESYTVTFRGVCRRCG